MPELLRTSKFGAKIVTESIPVYNNVKDSKGLVLDRAVLPELQVILLYFSQIYFHLAYIS